MPTVLEGGEDNGNFRVTTDHGEMVVREYRKSGIEKIRAELRLVGFLAEHGFPTPAPLPAGDEFVLEAKHPFAVFPWIEGDVPEAMTAALAARLGALLARMHVLTAGWIDRRVPVIDRVALLREAADSRPPLSGADAWRERIGRFLEDHADELDRLERLPTGPLHHDLHRQNVLVADGEVTALLDFDELNRGPLIVDVARVLQYAALDTPDLGLPDGMDEAVLAGYEAVRPLSEAERELLPVAFDLAGLVDSAIFVAHDAADVGVADLDECLSWRSYLRNTRPRRP
nr:phosphotransferase [Microbacterium pseudoresistens]